MLPARKQMKGILVVKNKIDKTRLRPLTGTCHRKIINAGKTIN